MADTDNNKPIIGVSSCLLGHEVRYDGGHKQNYCVAVELGKHFTYQAFCPEVAIGLGIPRPPIRLINLGDKPTAVKASDPTADYTDELANYGRKTIRELNLLSGFILKKDSPSCGMGGVRVYTEKAEAVSAEPGAGIFARTIMEADPTLPVEEEGRLIDSNFRENFIVRVFTRFRWLMLMLDGPSPASLVNFHSRHKFLLQAHNEAGFRDMGHLVAEAGKGNIEQVASDYFELAMQTLKHRSTRGSHSNVLMHIMGFLKNELDRLDKEDLLAVIDDYREGFVPLIVPITLLNHFLRQHPCRYIEQQYYLEPHPKELMLQNSR